MALDKINSFEEQHQLNVTIFKKLEVLESDVSKIEEEQGTLKESYQNLMLSLKDDFHGMEGTIQRAVEKGNSGVLEAVKSERAITSEENIKTNEKIGKLEATVEEQSEEIRELKNAPMKLAFKILIGAVSFLGAVISALLIAWLKIMLF